MKIVITGSRTLKNQALLQQRFDTMFRRHMKYSLSTDRHLTIIHGDAEGADKLVAAIFNQPDVKEVKYELDGMFFDVTVVAYPVTKADWQKFGGRAGPIRNGVMLDTEPDVVFGFWRAGLLSKGTVNCVSQAAARGIPVLVEVISEVLADRDTEQGVLRLVA